MRNLIKMDIHRLFKTSSFYVGLVISAALSALAIVIFGIVNLFIPYMTEEVMFTLSMMFPSLAWAEGVSIFEIIFSGLSVISLLIVCMLSAVYITEEQLSGYVKNIAGQVKTKSMMIASKFVTIALLTFCVMLAYSLGAVIAGLLFFHRTLNMSMMGAFFAAMFVKYLLYLSVGTIILFLCTLTKSKTLAIAIGVIFGTGITGIAYSTCNMILQFVLKIDVSIHSFVPDGLISSIGLDSDPSTLIHGAVVAICYIVLFLIFSSSLVNKRDTR